MKRKKPNALVVSDLEHADKVLAEIASLSRKIHEIEIRMDEDIATTKATASQDAAPLKSRIKVLESALATFGELNKQELFSKPKSREVQFGFLGFRKSTKVTTLPKLTLAMVLDKLKEYGLFDAIKTKESVDKEAMRSWPDQRLELVGMRRVEKDSFFYEIKAEDLED